METGAVLEYLPFVPSAPGRRSYWEELDISLPSHCNENLFVLVHLVGYTEEVIGKQDSTPDALSTYHMLLSEPIPLIIQKSSTGTTCEAALLEVKSMDRAISIVANSRNTITPALHVYYVRDLMAAAPVDEMQTWFRSFPRFVAVLNTGPDVSKRENSPLTHMLYDLQRADTSIDEKYKLGRHELDIMQRESSKLDSSKRNALQAVLQKYFSQVQRQSRRSNTDTQTTGQDRVVIIQGPPGSGKTRLIGAIVRSLLMLKEVPAIVISAESNTAFDAVQDAVLSEELADSNTQEDITDIFTRFESTKRRLESPCICRRGLWRSKEPAVKEMRKYVVSVPKGSAPCICWETRIQLSRKYTSMGRRAAETDRLARLKVAFGTHAILTYEYVSQLVSTRPGAVFIQNESSQSLDVNAMGPIGLMLKLKPSMLVLLGDPKLLPPTVVTDRSPLAGFPYISDALHRTMYDVLHTAGHSEIMLDVQYRMHPHICKFISTRFYDGKLRTAEVSPLIAGGVSNSPVSRYLESIRLQAYSSQKKLHGRRRAVNAAVTFFNLRRQQRRAQPQHAAHLNRPIHHCNSMTPNIRSVYVTTRSRGSIISRCVDYGTDLDVLSKLERSSRYVPAEVHFVVDFTCKVLAEVHLSKECKEMSNNGLPLLCSGEFSILLLPPYRAQVRRLSDLLQRSLNDVPDEQSWMKDAVTCETEDGAQGSEASLVVVSLGIDNTSTRSVFMEDERRMNVAISRAREGVVLVGNLVAVQGGSRMSVWNSFVQYCDGADRCFTVMK